jgi:hypothetical protein
VRGGNGVGMFNSRNTHTRSRERGAVQHHKQLDVFIHANDVNRRVECNTLSPVYIHVNAIVDMAERKGKIK